MLVQHTDSGLFASFRGHMPVVRLLLDRGADTSEATSDGVTPLCIASQQGHKSVDRLLRERS
jgi:ankyrin repeat protein